MFIETLILHAATWPGCTGRADLITVNELAGRAQKATPDNAAYELDEELAQNPSEEGAVRDGGRVFYDRSERELESAPSTVRRHLHFLGNAGVLQFFGDADLTTLEWIGKRLGQTTVVNARQSELAYDARTRPGASGAAWSQSTQEPLTTEEVSRFFGRDDRLLRQMIVRPTFAPMVLQRAFYDRHELFAGKFKA